MKCVYITGKCLVLEGNEMDWIFITYREVRICQKGACVEGLSNRAEMSETDRFSEPVGFEIVREKRDL
jgi:hypothetical protein